MTDDLPSGYSPTTIEKVSELLDNKLVTFGIPGTLSFVGLTKAKEGQWTEAGQYFAGAVGILIAIKIGKKLAPKLDQLLEWSITNSERMLLESWSTLRSDFEGQFLKRQARLCEEYTSEGFNPDRTTMLSLQDVFVPLDLSGAFGSGIISSENTPSSLTSENLDIWKLLARSRRDRKFRQMVILAKGGMGKTTLLRHIVLIYGQRNHRRYRAPRFVPILVRLRDWTDQLIAESSISLPMLITNFYVPSLFKNQPLKPPAKWAEKLLQGNLALVMFDGFDELPEDKRQQVSYWISSQMREYDNAAFILTSRPSAYRDYMAQKPAVPIFVNKLTPTQQKGFIQRWYLCQERCVRSEKQFRRAKEVAQERANHLIDQIDAQRSELGYMAENPLLLNMLVTFHRFDPAMRLPRQRIELYQGICKLQLEDRPKARLIRMLLPFKKSKLILQQFALGLTKAKKLKVKSQKLLAFLSSNSLLQEEEVTATDCLKQIVDISELLVEREPGEYEFPHLSFQGFFTATQLIEESDPTRAEANTTLLLQNWNEAIWRETVLLYAAQLTPKALDRLIRSACEINSEAAELAALCLKEYSRPEKLSAELTALFDPLNAIIKSSKYKRLDEFMQSQKWIEADQETYRLMITTVGKDVGQWFESTDLSEFPYEDLRILDGLWIRYSEGKWGFSVQKRIWQECGSPGPYNHETKAQWEKFGDYVGWRKNGRWVEYDQLDLTKTGLELPSMNVRGVGGWRVVGFGILFSLLSRPDL
jgi:hypothetical protein